MQSILIIQPGAFGDSILTLFLADALKFIFPSAKLTLAGHKDYCKFMPGRTAIDRLLDIDSLPLHHLFAPLLGDLIQDARTPTGGLALSGHDMVISFIFDQSGHFKDNIIAKNHGCIYCPISLRPDKAYLGHVTTYWLAELAMAHKEIAIAESHYINFNDHILSCGQIPTLSGGNLINSFHNDDEVFEKLMDRCSIELLGRDLVLIHPGSGGESKKAPLEWYFNLATQLTEMGAKPVFVTGPVENEKSPEMHAKICSLFSTLPQIDSEVLAIVTKRAKCYFGNDSGPSHLAGASGVPTVTIFGPTNPIQWRPVGEKNSVINFGKVYNP